MPFPVIARHGGRVNMRDATHLHGGLHVLNRDSTLGQRRHTALVAAVFSAWVAAPAAAQQVRFSDLPLNLHGAASVAAAETVPAVAEKVPAVAETPTQGAAQTQSDSAT